MIHTERDLLDALDRAYPQAAIIRQATIDDPEYRIREAAFYKRKHAMYYAKNPQLSIHRIDTTGIDPDSYDPSAPAYRRIDALMFGGMTKNGDYQRTAVEVKVSRADFKRDTEEKRAPWRLYTHRFVYLVPEGLVTKSEVPEGCGLWEFTGRSVRSAKPCKINHFPEELPQSFARSLAFRLQKAERGMRSIYEEG